jgi:RNA polymerase sigma-70 factor (ECF subfamily)
MSPAPRTEPNEDDELMIMLQSGDRSAYEKLVDKYQEPLEEYFYKSVRDQQLSEDLTQETLLKIYSVAWDYLPLGRFRAWMFEIAKKIMIEKIRHRANDVILMSRKTRPSNENLDPLNWIPHDQLPPEEIASHLELADTIDELLLEIPEEERLTFTLHHYSGLTMSEVGEIMESDLVTTQNRFSLAQNKLASKLKAKGIHLDLNHSELTDKTSMESHQHPPVQ